MQTFKLLLILFFADTSYSNLSDSEVAEQLCILYSCLAHVRAANNEKILNAA